MKKSIVTMLFLMLGMIVFTACGSKMDKTAEEFKNKIIEEESYKDKNKEENFSFLIYKDKSTNRYLADVWLPVEKDSQLEYYFFFDESKKMDKSKSETAFNDKKASGNYEVIYKSGKFK